MKRSDEPLDQLDKPVQKQDVKDESFTGGYQVQITPGGAMKISYDYAPANAKGKFA